LRHLLLTLMLSIAGVTGPYALHCLQIRMPLMLYASLLLATRVKVRMCGSLRNDQQLVMHVCLIKLIQRHAVAAAHIMQCCFSMSRFSTQQVELLSLQLMQMSGADHCNAA